MNFCWPAHGLWACVDRQTLSGVHTSQMCAKLPPSSLIFAGRGWGVGEVKDDKNPSHTMATHLSACLSSTPIHALSTADGQLMATDFEGLTSDRENWLIS